jgi:hypothetical protein
VALRASNCATFIGVILLDSATKHFAVNVYPAILRIVPWQRDSKAVWGVIVGRVYAKSRH